jgi:hypothetical protein
MWGLETQARIPPTTHQKARDDIGNGLQARETARRTPVANNAAPASRESWLQSGHWFRRREGKRARRATAARTARTTNRMRLYRLTANPVALPALLPLGNASHVRTKSVYLKMDHSPMATLLASKVPVIFGLALRRFPAISSPPVSTAMP